MSSSGRESSIWRRVAGQNNAKTMIMKMTITYTQTNWIIQSVLMILMIRKGELHLTESVCPRDFLGELEYWGLSALHLGYIKRYKIIFSKFKYLRLAHRSYSPVEDNNNKVQISSCSSTQFPQSHAALTRCRGPPGSSPLLTMGSIKRTRWFVFLFSSSFLLFFFSQLFIMGSRVRVFLQFFGNRHSVSFKTPAHFGYFLLENKKAALGRYFVLSSPVP